MSYLASPTFYLAVSFVAFLSILYRYSWRPLIGFLDAYIAKVKSNLQQAEAQKQEAHQAFEEETKLCEQLDEHVEAILKGAQQQCDLLRHNIKAEIEAEALEQTARLKLTTEKMKQDFLYQLNDQIADQIINKVHQWAKTHLQPEIQTASQKKAIDLLQKLKPFDS
jgi:F-type H+-transporting ATPase subunit b